MVRKSPLPRRSSRDRSGLGQSEWDQQTPTPQHAVTRLRRVLEALAVKPRGTLVVSNATTHLVPREDPDLIVAVTDLADAA